MISPVAFFGLFAFPVFVHCFVKYTCVDIARWVVDREFYLIASWFKDLGRVEEAKSTT